MNPSDSFATDYQDARQKFRAAAVSSGGRLDSFEHPELGPDGKSLFTDIARFGPEDARAILVLISGTHGVEGFCGSGAQIDFLLRGETNALPPEAGILMIHAINPYGFAWLRRVTHENVDLNRNWLDFSQSLPSNALYEKLHHAFCPKEWTKESQIVCDEAIRAIASQFGNDAVSYSMRKGQYSNPDGVYFGGQNPSWSRKTQEEIFARYVKGAEFVGVLDFHTGLGPWGYLELISTFSPDSSAFFRSRNWYGASVKSTVDGSSLGAPIIGDGMTAAERLLPESVITSVALEFGTRPKPQVLKALRADNWLHHRSDNFLDIECEIKLQMRDAFYPETAEWKAMVAGQSLLVCRQALLGLSEQLRSVPAVSI